MESGAALKPAFKAEEMEAFRPGGCFQLRAEGITLKRGLIIGIIVLAAIGAGIAITLLVVDIHEDRQYKVKVTGKVQVYDAESPPGYTRGDDGVIEVLHPQDRVDVMRVLSHDDFQAIKIRLRDGREGYIFCCENFEFSK
jgi:hypothetical protein